MLNALINIRIEEQPPVWMVFTASILGALIAIIIIFLGKAVFHYIWNDKE